MPTRLSRNGWLLTLIIAASGHADDWPQWGGPKRDLVWRETGVVDKLPAKLKYQWRVPIGMGYAGPAVWDQSADGSKPALVFVTDRRLDQGVSNPENQFDKSPVGGTERIVALEAATGKIVWEKAYPCRYAVSYPSGPRVTPTINEGRLYTVGAMGDCFCLDAATGAEIWSKQFLKEFNAKINTWGYSAAPLVDGDLVIVLVGGANGGCVVAFDKATGAERWRALDADDPGYCPPIIYEVAGVRQLIIWTPLALNSLNPKTGKTLWSQPFQLRSGLSIPMPIYEPKEHLLFVTAFYNGPLMMKLEAQKPAAQILWKGKSDSEIKTDGLHSIMPTPYFRDGHIYGVCSYGQLRCLKADTGERVWESIKPTGSGRWWNAFLIPHGDRTIICNEQGELIFAKLAPTGYEELSRAFLIEPTNKAQRRNVVWSHPAFAHRCIFARNDKEIVCVDLSAK